MLEADFEADFGEMLESDFEAFDEAFDEAYDEAYDEAAPFKPRPIRRGRPGLKVPPRGNVVPKRAAAGYATLAALDAVAKRLDGRIHTNATAIKALDGRSRTVEREVNHVSAALKKEITYRKKQTAELRKSVDDGRQIAMMLPLLGGGTDKFSKMLPMLLYGGGLGGSGGSSDSNNGMMTTMMMMVALSA
jgi:hypothetical protein